MPLFSDSAVNLVPENLTAPATVIAITGASASGKSWLAATLSQQLERETGSDHLAVLAEDAYYCDQSHLPIKQREQTNYDHPSAFDHELLARHLLELRAGRPIHVPQYDFCQHTRAPGTVVVQPAKVILVEGILLLSSAELREIFDISIFVDTPLDICLMRRIRRDMEERGRSLDSVINQYQRTVRPAYFAFVNPSREYADMVITHGEREDSAIDMIKTKIHRLVAQ